MQEQTSRGYILELRFTSTGLEETQMKDNRYLPPFLINTALVTFACGAEANAYQVLNGATGSSIVLVMKMKLNAR